MAQPAHPAEPNLLVGDSKSGGDTDEQVHNGLPDEEQDVGSPRQVDYDVETVEKVYR